MLLFRALTIDCAAFQRLTVDYKHIYGNIYRRMHSDSTPSLVVYGVNMPVTAVTIESMVVTSPEVLYSTRMPTFHAFCGLLIKKIILHNNLFKMHTHPYSLWVTVHG